MRSLCFFLVLPAIWAARPAQHEQSILEALSAAEILRSVSVVGSDDIEDLSTAAEKKACTGRIPLVGKRLCLVMSVYSNWAQIAQTATDSIFEARQQDSQEFIKESLMAASKVNVEQSLQAVAAAGLQSVPDLLIEIAWMGCPSCNDFKDCHQEGPTCKKEKASADAIMYMWESLMVLSLKSLVGGSCWTLTDLVLMPAMGAAGVPALASGYLATYITTASSMLPWVLKAAGDFAGKRVMADTLGRYCIYLANHKPNEPGALQEYKEEVNCIDHLYSFSAPSLLGFLPSGYFKCPGKSLMCWPVQGVKGEAMAVLDASQEASSSEEPTQDQIEAVSTAELDTLGRADSRRICTSDKGKERDKALKRERTCLACKRVMHSVGWRMELFAKELGAIKSSADNSDSKESGIVEQLSLDELSSRLVIHRNNNNECVHITDKQEKDSCHLDYSMCAVDDPTAERCSATSSVQNGKLFCTSLCTTPCTASDRVRFATLRSALGSQPYCFVDSEMQGQDCYNGDTLDTVQAGKMFYWVNCEPQRAGERIASWNPTMAKTADAGMRRQTSSATPGNEKEESNLNRQAAREILESLSTELATPKMKRLDAAQLRLSRLMAEKDKFEEARDAFCVEAECCDQQL